jgi:hypothetical protein
MSCHRRGKLREYEDHGRSAREDGDGLVIATGGPAKNQHDDHCRNDDPEWRQNRGDGRRNERQARRDSSTLMLKSTSDLRVLRRYIVSRLL